MPFPGLYNYVTHVPTKPATVPIAAVFTHVLHLLMYLLLYLRTYCTYYCTYCKCTYFTYCCAVRTTNCYTYVLHHWTKATAAEKIGTYRTYILYVRAPRTDVRTACTYCDARTYFEEKLPAAGSTYLLLYVRTYCTYLVDVYLRMHLRTYCTHWCSYRCTYVPTVRTALTNAINTYPHKTTLPTVRTYYCCTYSWWWMYSGVFIYGGTYVLYLLHVRTDNVRT